jgi:DNA-binding GntR family transcriptional regulator
LIVEEFDIANSLKLCIAHPDIVRLRRIAKKLGVLQQLEEGYVKSKNLSELLLVDFQGHRQQ